MVHWIRPVVEFLEQQFDEPSEVLAFAVGAGIRDLHRLKQATSVSDSVLRLVQHCDRLGFVAQDDGTELHGLELLASAIALRGGESAERDQALRALREVVGQRKEARSARRRRREALARRGPAVAVALACVVLLGGLAGWWFGRYRLPQGASECDNAYRDWQRQATLGGDPQSAAIAGEPDDMRDAAVKTCMLAFDRSVGTDHRVAAASLTRLALLDPQVDEETLGALLGVALTLDPELELTGGTTAEAREALGRIGRPDQHLPPLDGHEVLVVGGSAEAGELAAWLATELSGGRQVLAISYDVPGLGELLGRSPSQLLAEAAGAVGVVRHVESVGWEVAIADPALRRTFGSAPPSTIAKESEPGHAKLATYLQAGLDLRAAYYAGRDGKLFAAVAELDRVAADCGTCGLRSYALALAELASAAAGLGHGFTRRFNEIIQAESDPGRPYAMLVMDMLRCAYRAYDLEWSGSPAQCWPQASAEQYLEVLSREERERLDLMHAALVALAEASQRSAEQGGAPTRTEGGVDPGAKPSVAANSVEGEEEGGHRGQTSLQLSGGMRVGEADQTLREIAESLRLQGADDVALLVMAGMLPLASSDEAVQGELAEVLAGLQQPDMAHVFPLATLALFPEVLWRDWDAGEDPGIVEQIRSLLPRLGELSVGETAQAGPARIASRQIGLASLAVTRQLTGTPEAKELIDNLAFGLRRSSDDPAALASAVFQTWTMWQRVGDARERHSMRQRFVSWGERLAEELDTDQDHRLLWAGLRLGLASHHLASGDPSDARRHAIAVVNTLPREATAASWTLPAVRVGAQYLLVFARARQEQTELALTRLAEADQEAKALVSSVAGSTWTPAVVADWVELVRVSNEVVAAAVATWSGALTPVQGISEAARAVAGWELRAPADQGAARILHLVRGAANDALFLFAWEQPELRTLAGRVLSRGGRDLDQYSELELELGNHAVGTLEWAGLRALPVLHQYLPFMVTDDDQLDAEAIGGPALALVQEVGRAVREVNGDADKLAREISPGYERHQRLRSLMLMLLVAASDELSPSTQGPDLDQVSNALLLRLDALAPHLEDDPDPLVPVSVHLLSAGLRSTSEDYELARADLRAAQSLTRDPGIEALGLVVGTMQVNLELEAGDTDAALQHLARLEQDWPTAAAALTYKRTAVLLGEGRYSEAMEQSVRARQLIEDASVTGMTGVAKHQLVVQWENRRATTDLSWTGFTLGYDHEWSMGVGASSFHRDQAGAWLSSQHLRSPRARYHVDMELLLMEAFAALLKGDEARADRALGQVEGIAYGAVVNELWSPDLDQGLLIRTAALADLHGHHALALSLFEIVQGLWTAQQPRDGELLSLDHEPAWMPGELDELDPLLETVARLRLGQVQVGEVEVPAPDSPRIPPWGPELLLVDVLQLQNKDRSLAPLTRMLDLLTQAEGLAGADDLAGTVLVEEAKHYLGAGGDLDVRGLAQGLADSGYRTQAAALLLSEGASGDLGAIELGFSYLPEAGNEQVANRAGMVLIVQYFFAGQYAEVARIARELGRREGLSGSERDRVHDYAALGLHKSSSPVDLLGFVQERLDDELRPERRLYWRGVELCTGLQQGEPVNLDRETDALLRQARRVVRSPKREAVVGLAEDLQARGSTSAQSIAQRWLDRELGSSEVQLLMAGAAQLTDLPPATRAEFYQRAAKQAESIGRDELFVEAATGQAQLWIQQGELGRGAEQLRTAADRAAKLDDLPMEVELRWHLAGILEQLGRHAELLDQRRWLVDAYRNHPDLLDNPEQNLSACVGNVAVALSLAGQEQAALPEIERALALAHRGGWTEVEQWMVHTFAKLDLPSETKLSWLDARIEVEQAVPHLPTHSSLLGSKVNLLKQAGDWRGAEEALRASLDVDRKLNDESAIVWNLGNLYLVLPTAPRNSRERVAALERELDVARQAGRRNVVHWLLVQLMDVELGSQEWPKPKQRLLELNEELKLNAEAIGDPSVEAQVHFGLAVIALRSREWPTVRRELYAALDLWKVNKSLESTVASWSTLVGNCTDPACVGEVLGAAIEYRSRLENRGPSYALGAVCFVEGLLAQQQGEWEQFVEAMEAAARAGEESGVPELVAYSSLHLVAAYGAEGRIEEARAQGRKGLEVAEELEDSEVKAQLLSVVFNHHIIAGAFEEAVGYARALYDMMPRTGSTLAYALALVERDDQLNELLGQLATELGPSELLGARVVHLAVAYAGGHPGVTQFESLRSLVQDLEGLPAMEYGAHGEMLAKVRSDGSAPGIRALYACFSGSPSKGVILARLDAWRQHYLEIAPTARSVELVSPTPP